MKAMKFYIYRQNCSGGSFRYAKDKYSEYVFIEAKADYLANAIAEHNGIYFDGVKKDWDCSCCGDRWRKASSYDGFDKLEFKEEVKKILLSGFYQPSTYDEDKPLIVIHFDNEEVVNIYPLLRSMSEEEKKAKVKENLDIIQSLLES